MFWNKYPYSDMHELNLDWIIGEIKKLHIEMSDFEAINEITFDGAWDITKQYPAWCIVNDSGAGYISIKPVPSGVLLTNTEYWRGVVDYTATIADLQNRVVQLESDVVDINDRIDLLTNRKFVVVGDSYGNWPDNDGRNFVERAFHNLGITDYYDFHLGSAGFSRPYGTLNFLDVLQNNESAIPDKTKITDVIVCGGGNDQIPANITDTPAGIVTFVNYVKTNYPNATIHIGHFSRSIDPAFVNYITQSVGYYKDCVNSGAVYMDNSQYIMMKFSFFRADSHPTVAGVEALAKYLESYILYGYIDVVETATNTLASNTGSTLVTDLMTQRQHNGTVSIEGTGGNFAAIHPDATWNLIAGVTSVSHGLKFVDGFLIAGTVKYTIAAMASNFSVYAPVILTVRPISGNEIEINYSFFANSPMSFSGSSDIQLFGGNTSLIAY